MPSFTIAQIRRTPCEIDSNTRNVLRRSLQRTWDTFESNPLRLTPSDAGNGGIFELMKYLLAPKWIFGVFRTTVGAAEGRESQLISLQWMGGKLRRWCVKGQQRASFPRWPPFWCSITYEI
ncbi:hypothetical protein TraAM80_03874 [Trypanosoma rangeli]|uniref:Uncharacterized protein n=1 Tax=Trypanosoma rangeli TaxID=5698 RepID=A0A3R7KH54_TRYRA|nr:uncharacterized protein TraAM80_03874 [Trypanosoma rangeli]RNF06408.1 hypothetical protein TraAM80_03874 [Trypanosoma rangeli]|eukprot:RNF06408.1 hypothetical protein TraAM80_03874 [Trypanosoma rangeli]